MPAARTWQRDPAPAPAPAMAVERVQDPAVRAILLTISRALKAICADIDRRCVGDQDKEGR